MITQYEILKHAMNGISAQIIKEAEINENTKREYGHENSISLHRIEKLNKQFNEVSKMMYDIEQAVNEIK